jgi:hypothetical protein
MELIFDRRLLRASAADVGEKCFALWKLYGRLSGLAVAVESRMQWRFPGGSALN